jgi:hypothetical protein
LKDALVKTERGCCRSKKMKTALSAVKMETLAMDVHMVWMKEMSGLMTSAGLLLQRKTLNFKEKFHSFLKINLSC